MTSSFPRDAQTITMVAYRYKPGISQPVAERVAIPSPGPDQVLLRILAAGVCHSDLSALDPETAIGKGIKQLASSFTIGHEGSGVIMELGSSVASAFSHLTVGTYVAIGPSTCDKEDCVACSSGRLNLCPHVRPHGVGVDGTWAEFMTVRAAALVPISRGPGHISPGVAAVATDAALTVYHAMKTCCALKPEHTVLCVGAGGLGLSGVAIAKDCLGVRCVIASDTRQAALQSAVAAGADFAVPPEELQSLLDDKKILVDFAFDFVGSQDTFDMCFSVIRPGGAVHMLGLGAETLSIMPIFTIKKDLTFRTSFWGTRSELGDVLEAIGEGKLRLQVETRPMSHCGQVLEDMHSGRLRGRVALIPDSLLDHTGP